MSSILLATLPSLAPPHFLESIIAHAASHSTTRLIIVLFSRHFNVDAHLDTFSELQAVSHTQCWDIVQRILTFTYVQATKVAWQMNNVLMPIDVLLKGFNEDLDPNLGVGLDICYRVSGDSIAVPLPESIALLRQSYIPLPGNHYEIPTGSCTPSDAEDDQSTPSQYHVTALGGTFDHLHAGHKILLSMAAWITCEKLIVGFTDESLLQSKPNKHLLESFEQRVQNVRDFLTFIKPQITYDLIRIYDLYGPTELDPDIQVVMVSKETLSSADPIVRRRAEKHLPPLHIFFTDVISATSASLDHDDMLWLKENKLSSTYIRQWIVDREREKEAEEGKISTL